jgi:hypothetical protein
MAPLRRGMRAVYHKEGTGPGIEYWLRSLENSSTQPGSERDRQPCRRVASVFLVNDDERGLHHDYEVWLEELAPHAPNDVGGLEAVGPRTVGTTVPERTPVQAGQDRRRAHEVERNS